MKIKWTPGKDWDIIAAHAICPCPPTLPEVPVTVSITQRHSTRAVVLFCVSWVLFIYFLTQCITSDKFHLQLKELGSSLSLVIS